jgi:hypothetical protein
MLRPTNIPGGLAGGVGRGIIRGVEGALGNITAFNAARLGLQLGREIVAAAPRVGAGVGILGGARLLAEAPVRNRYADQFQEVLSFPKDLPQQQFMSLRFVKYVKRNINDRKTITDKKFIALPIPNNLVDSFTVDYDTKGLGPVLGAFTETATGGGLNPLADAGAAFGLQALSNYASNLSVGGQKIFGGSEDLLRAGSAISGVAINPFLTVTFKNPQFKNHSFSWKLIPRNKEESDEIRKIIQAIKYHMSPGLLTRSGVFFTYPEMVIIKLHPNDDYTYKFKPCVIKSFDVNYAPAGAPSFYWYNGAPTAVEIKMSLQEIEYFTKLDYLDEPFINEMSGNVLSAALTGVAGAPATLFTDALTSLPQFNILRNLPFGLDRITGAQ